MHEVLEDRAVITLSGQDRKTLLQGIITNNLDLLKDGDGLYSALLTPQGKFLNDFFLFENEETIYLDCEAKSSNDLFRRLMMYRLRSNVEIELTVETYDVITSMQQIVGEPVSFVDPRHSNMGYRIIATKGKYDGSDEPYHERRISLGIPEGTYDFIPDKSTIHEGHFEEINGVDFEKGCYVGQEVIARMKYRGKIKKAMFPVTLSGPAPDFGSEITDEKSNKIGDLRSNCGKNAIALFRLQNLEFGKKYNCCGIKVTPFKSDFYKETDDE